MQRIDDATAVAALPVPEALNAPGYFTEGNPGTGQAATIVRGSWANMVQEELMSILAAAGIAPSKVTYNQVLAALQQLTGSQITTIVANANPFNAALTAAQSGTILIDATAGNSTLTLPAAAARAALKYRFLRLDATANTVTVQRAGADVIDGAANFALNGQGSTHHVEGDGVSNWRTTVASVAAATNAIAGIIRIATAAEATAGVSTTTAITPAELAAAIEALVFDYGVATNVGNAYTVALNPAPPNPLPDGFLIRWKVPVSNGPGGVTLAATPNGPAPVVNPDGSALANGQLPASAIALSSWDLAGNRFQLLDLAKAPVVGTAGALNIGAGLRNDGAGNLQVNEAVTSSGANQNLNAASHASQFVATAASTYALPLNTTLWNGYEFTVSAQGGAVTINVNAADKINGGAAGAGIVIPQGWGATVFTDANHNWFVFENPLNAIGAAGLVTVQQSSGSIPIPAGVTRAKVTVIGAGGGGGSFNAGTGYPSSAGGAGGVAVKYLSGLVSGNTLTATIGSGGTGGSAAANNPGTAGGNTSLSSGSQAIATITGFGGGAGGAGAQTGIVAGGAGGIATGGDINITGQPGGTGGQAVGTGSGTHLGGGGSPALGLGMGGTVGIAASAGLNVNGGNGSGFGAGGGNVAVNGVSPGSAAGGNGAGGVIIIEWFP